MTIVYVDSSASLKRVVSEAGKGSLRRYLRDAVAEGAALVSSELSHLEVWRSLRRHSVANVPAAVEIALSGIALSPVTDETFWAARLNGSEQLRTLDALHLASAAELDADIMMTYDLRLAASAEAVGLAVLAP